MISRKVEYDAPEFDAQLGLDGLHRVHPEVKPRPRKTILPPDLFKRYAQLVVLARPEGFQGVPHRRAGQRETRQRDTMPEPAQAIAHKMSALRHKFNTTLF